MRTAIRPNNSKSPSASSKSFPAPVGGWNAKNSLAAMQEDEASVLDNWFPESSYVRLRGGSHEFADTQTNVPVESLMNYTGLTTERFFAASNGEIFDITSGGTIGSAAITGLTNDRWQFTNYGNSAGNFLYIVNGADNPRYYDGSTWTEPTLTGSGLTKSNLIHIQSFKERLFFIEKDKLWFWYLPVNSISGALSKFDLSSFCTKGGYLMAMATWSRDAGDGADDYAVFITSEGEILIYQGVDPNDAANWALSSIYTIASPIGRRCFMRIASELVIITREGFVPLSKVLLYSKAVAKTNISNNIEDAVNVATNLYGDNFGWQPLFFSQKNMAIFNIPVDEGDEQHQYVINTSTSKWCRFTGLNGNCWAVFDDALYFGANDGTIWEAESGTADADASIETAALTAYSYFGSKSKLKRWTLARPIMRSTGELLISMKISVDFEYNPATSQYSAEETSGTEWDVSDWDVSDWADGFRVTKGWKGVNGVGHSAALGIATSTKLQEIQWISTDFIYELGGFV